MQGKNDIGHKDWKAKDFERYYKNNMPPEERHALEKAALDDPFLQDALEGYAFTHTPVEDVQVLRKKLIPKEDKAIVAWYKKPIATGLFKAAAILVIFAGIAWIWLAKNNQSKTDETTLASVEKESVPATTVAQPPAGSEVNLATTTLAIPALPENAAANKEQPEQVYKKDKPVEKKGVMAIAENKSITPDLIATYDPRSAKLAKPFVRADTIEVISLGMSSLKKEISQSRVEELEGADGEGSMKVIKGRVLDLEGMPVPYARIRESNNNMLISTDKDGYFYLNNTGNFANVNIDVNALGYQSTNAIIASNNPENKIVMKETANMALNEVAITKSDKAASASRMKSIEPVKGTKGGTIKTVPLVSFENAEPVNGWSKYNERIKVLYSLEKKIDSTGSVSLSFSIDAKGKPANIQVTKSLNPIADSAAIRLLKNNLHLREKSKGKKSTVVITFR